MSEEKIEMLSKKLNYDKIKQHYEKKLKQKEDKLKDVKDGIPFKKLKIYVEHDVKINKDHKIFYDIIKYFNKNTFYQKQIKTKFDVNIKDFNIFVSLEKMGDDKLYFKRMVLELGDIELDRKQFRINIYGNKYYYTFYKSHEYKEGNKIDLEPSDKNDNDKKYYKKLISKLEKLYNYIEIKLKEIDIVNSSVFYEKTEDNNIDYEEKSYKKKSEFVPYKKPDYRKRMI
jgi:hypothetical protein